MDEAELRSDLATGETPSIEFKRCGNSVGRDTFETICSFANSFGGSIYLGVEDDGNAIGIPEEKERDQRGSQSERFRPAGHP